MLQVLYWSLIFFTYWIQHNFIIFLLKIGDFLASGSFIRPQWGKTIYEVVYELTTLWLFYHKSNKGCIKTFKVSTAVQCINVRVRNSKDFVPIVHYAYYGGVKFICSEKATKFCEIFPLLLTAVHTVKSKGKMPNWFFDM